MRVSAFILSAVQHSVLWPSLLFSCGWTFQLFPVFSLLQKAWKAIFIHVSLCVSVRISLESHLEVELLGSKEMCVSSFTRYCQIALYNDCIIPGNPPSSTRWISTAQGGKKVALSGTTIFMDHSCFLLRKWLTRILCSFFCFFLSFFYLL